VTTRQLILGIVPIVCAATVAAQQHQAGGRAELYEHVRALKGALAKNNAAPGAYSWTETTETSFMGEVTEVTRTECRYGPDGTVQKTPLDAPPPLSASQSRRRERGMMREMEAVVALVHEYIPPDVERTRAAVQGGRASVSPRPEGSAALVIDNYLKPGDRLSIELDLVAGKVRRVAVSTYDGKPEEVVTFTARYEDLPDGTSHVQQSELVATKQHVRVTITNAQYIKLSS
jgi:hypothetical protein